jgi:hypothetical protein
MANWFNIKVKTEASQFDKVRTKILGWPEEVAREVYWPELEKIGQEGVELIRFLILSNKDTKKYERTGVPGRVDTGRMVDSVTSRARERSGNSFSLFVGWIRGEPGYAIFQEQGTKNGVRALNAIGQAEVYMLERLRGLSKGKFTGSYDAS